MVVLLARTEDSIYFSMKSPRESSDKALTLHGGRVCLRAGLPSLGRPAPRPARNPRGTGPMKTGPTCFSMLVAALLFALVGVLGGAPVSRAHGGLEETPWA